MQDNQECRFFLTDVEFGRIDEVRKYLDNGGDVNFSSVLCETALHKASRIGDIELCRLLLAHDNIEINALEVFGYSPLHEAIYHDRLDIVELLIEHRADVNIVGECYATTTSAPLHFAAERNPDITLLLLEARANVNIPNCAGWPPLNKAIKYQHKENCILLLQYGADPTLCDPELSDTKFFTYAAQEAFEILEHNSRVILQMVGYSLALSMFSLPFEVIKEICKYYDSPYWWKKFDTEDIGKLKEVVLPTYTKKFLWFVSGDIEIVDTNSDGEECISCSNMSGDTVNGSQHVGYSLIGSLCSDHDSPLVNEQAVTISMSEREHSDSSIQESGNQNSRLLDEILEWISTLPTWFQEHMMSLHLIERLMGLLEYDIIGTAFISANRGKSFEAESTKDSSRYHAAPYTVEMAKGTDYVTEYQVELVGEGMMDSAFCHTTTDWNSGGTF
ncbi:hypothetical protein EDM53_02195 [Rickettsiales endosymbiont of Peranema trichophorum]|uniref:ankyrin repeat domain-containing protein n=1 Tax=Rickettsiales endosymbiont of Peranema trichophorum TaxID=2486577 RepID=UPI0010239866|nr:ankyrin repeat domain-containing protein [Rickettsiales endosymbiont of Peranema trichophorum]RZI47380.1 hypothetical protein EDM53_02195 [Rickettsiales endosymbiont of Peranema trichophorum]